MSSSKTEFQKPRVFVSSVISGFEEYREAARLAITAANAIPILAEDFPAISSSPRNACLDGVRSCDALVLIVGSRGGFITPSRKLVVEEELEEANKAGLSIFIFLQITERDQSAEAIVKRISSYTGGYFRKTFDSPESLRDVLKKAIESAVFIESEKNMATIINAFSDMPDLGEQASLRLVMTSLRAEEVIDPVTLGSAAFKTNIMEIAHRKDVSLFSYDVGKKTRVNIDKLIIFQEDSNRSGSVDHARLELSSDGTIVIDANVTNRVESNEKYSMQPLFEIVEEDIRKRLQACFSFCRIFWENRDPYIRHQQFAFNAGLNNVGSRVIVSDRTPKSSFSAGFDNRKSVISFDSPRRCNRADLTNSVEQIKTIVTMLRRRLERTSSF